MKSCRLTNEETAAARSDDMRRPLDAPAGIKPETPSTTAAVTRRTTSTGAEQSPSSARRWSQWRRRDHPVVIPEEMPWVLVRKNISLNS